MAARERVTRSETIDELQRQLIRLFPQAELKRLSNDEMKADLELIASSATRRDFSISPSGNSLNLYIDRSDGTRVWGYTISSARKFNEHERRFAREFIHVFNDDVRSASQWGRDEELWLSLQQTRLSRVIARVSPFHTPIFLKWLRAFENALSLRYERQPFAIQLVLTKQLEWVKRNPAVDYVKFSGAMSLSEALFEEKWTRALAASDDLALVGLGHDRGVSGIIYVNDSITVESIPDHTDKDRVNRSLRLMSRRLRITTQAHQVLLRKVSAIDGAIVLGPDGSILDAGCMICDPTDSILARAGIDKPKRFPGARSTAAWNASLHGIAIKVSEDGPITVFKQGEMILQV